MHEHPQRPGVGARTDLPPDDERLVPADRTGIRVVAVVVVLPGAVRARCEELDLRGTGRGLERDVARAQPDERKKRADGDEHPFHVVPISRDFSGAR